MAIVEEYKIELSSETENVLRNIISAWSNNIPYHSHRDFGKNIRINEISYSPIYGLNIITQFYSQHDVQKERPYGNGLTYPSNSQNSRSKYERKSFVKHVDIYCLPGSETVHTCSGCGGRGKISCSPCRGSGVVNCGSCGGTGNCNQCGGSGKKRCFSCNGGRVSCSSCGGRGTFWEYDYNTKQQITKRCFSCGGSGSQRCTNCGGNGQTNCFGCAGGGRCSSCGGRRTVTCNSCGGSGQITCSNCKGSGKTISYTERNEKWDFGNIIDFVFPQLLRTEFKTLAIKQNATRDLVLEKNLNRLSGDFFITEPEYFQLIYKSLFNKSVMPSGLDVQPNASLLEQAIKVSRIPAYYVNYVYDGNTYSLIVFLKDKTVFEENGPITLFRKDLIHNSHKLLKRRNYGKSAEFAEKAVKMGLDIKDPLLEKINKKITTKIKAAYKIGSFAGAWLMSYILALYILSSFKNPKYMLDVLNETTQNWGNRFIVVNNAIIIIFIVIISLIKCVRLASKSMFPFAGKEVKPEVLRFTFGFLTSIFYTAFIAITILLLNCTGILLPFTRVIYLLVEALLPFIPYDSLKNLI